MHVWISILVMVLGLVLYLIAANPKVQELGRMSFFAGLLAFLLKFDAMVSFFGTR